MQTFKITSRIDAVTKIPERYLAAELPAAGVEELGVFYIGESFMCDEQRRRGAVRRDRRGEGVALARLDREPRGGVRGARLRRLRLRHLRLQHPVRRRAAGAQQARMQALVDEIRPFVDEHYWLPLYSMGSMTTQREEELGYRPIAGNQGRVGALREPLPCWSAFTEGHITHDGKLSACCFDAGDKWIMADLNDVSFLEDCVAYQ